VTFLIFTGHNIIGKTLDKDVFPEERESFFKNRSADVSDGFENICGVIIVKKRAKLNHFYTQVGGL